ncbi:ERI1 exoribonuclease 2 [Gonapodya sp. JEL0774]|nr:ERI1 exoribonuclease 2 [Gonapodya sp. JEL0774]
MLDQENVPQAPPSPSVPSSPKTLYEMSNEPRRRPLWPAAQVSVGQVLPPPAKRQKLDNPKSVQDAPLDEGVKREIERKRTEAIERRKESKKRIDAAKMILQRSQATVVSAGVHITRPDGTAPNVPTASATASGVLLVPNAIHERHPIALQFAHAVIDPLQQESMAISGPRAAVGVMSVNSSVETRPSEMAPLSTPCTNLPLETNIKGDVNSTVDGKPCQILDDALEPPRENNTSSLSLPIDDHTNHQPLQSLLPLILKPMGSHSTPPHNACYEPKARRMSIVSSTALSKPRRTPLGMAARRIPQIGPARIETNAQVVASALRNTAPIVSPQTPATVNGTVIRAASVKRKEQMYAKLGESARDIVLDFESTCWPKEDTNGIMLQEREEDKRKLVQEISITQAQVNAAAPLEDCLVAFHAWLKENGLENGRMVGGKKRSWVFATWSDWDLNTLLSGEARWRKIKLADYFSVWIDVKATFRAFYNQTPSGVKGSLEFLGMSFEGVEHKGIDDAM